MRGLKLLASVVSGSQPDISLWSWATVTDDSPLRVKLDGEDASLDITPDSLVGGGLAVNDRVWVQLVTNANPTRRYRRLVVLGRAGGTNVYPVGAIYMSIDPTDPGTLFGGTWTAIEDRFLVGAGNLYDPEDTGGEATHTLTVNEMPSHSHGLTALKFTGGGSNTVLVQTTGTGAGVAQTTDSAGSGAAHNNLPPYLAVHIWERTS